MSRRQRRTFHFSYWLYRILLLAYPAGFRVEHGHDASLTFAQLHGDTRGLKQRASLWIRTIRSVVADGMRDRIDRGEPRKQAVSEAGREFGTIVLVKTVTDVWSRRWIDQVRQDVRYSLRQLKRSPRFAVAAILTLALGTGATATVYTVADGVLFRGLPYSEPRRLVQVWNNFRQQKLEKVVFSHPEYLDYRSRIRALEGIAAYGQNSVTFNHGGEPEELWVSAVSTNLFDLLGVQPLLGRVFTAQDSSLGRSNVVILSYGLWLRRFGADPGALGSSVMLQGEPHLVVGVMPATFRFPAAVAELWRPLVFSGEMVEERQRGSRSLWIIGRLRRGTSVDDARREMSAHADNIAAEHRDAYPPEVGYAVTVIPLQDQVTGRVRGALLMLFGAAGILMLIACANVANLLLARATERQAEMATRVALGASRGRVLLQMFTESLSLALIGGAAGTLLAVCSVRMLLRWMPAGLLPRMEEVSVQAPILWFSLGLSLLTGLLFGLAPAVQAFSSNLVETLQDARRTTSGRTGRTLRRLLTVSEVALALVLLAGAGLLIRSFARIVSVPPGFNSDSALTMRIALPTAKYATRSQLAFFKELTGRARNLPGVEAVGLVTALPFSGRRNDWSISLDGVSDVLGGTAGLRPSASYSAVNADYFRSMGIPLLRGRIFSASDATDAPVVIVNHELAQRFWPEQNALGKRLKMGAPASPWPWRTIVGIVGDVRLTNLETAVKPEIFVFDADERKPQAPSMFLVVRANRDPLELAAPARQLVASLDPDQAVTSIQLLSDRVSLSLAERRFHLLLLATFAVVALTLAAVGVNGVIAYSVSQRTREIGLRMALGAQKSDVLRLVLGQGLRLVGAGLAVGLIGALSLGSFLKSLLFEVEPTDPFTLATVAGVLATVALLACWLPARRAAGLCPTDALRHQ